MGPVQLEFEVACMCLCSIPWSGSRPNREFLRPKRILNVLPAEVVPLGYETCMVLMWQLMGTKSTQLSGWGRTPACLKEGHTLFLSSRENWKKTGWTCRTELFLEDRCKTSSHNSPHWSILRRNAQKERGEVRKTEINTPKNKNKHEFLMKKCNNNIQVKAKYFHKKQICLFLFSDIHLCLYLASLRFV